MNRTFEVNIWWSVRGGLEKFSSESLHILKGWVGPKKQGGRSFIHISVGHSAGFMETFLISYDCMPNVCFAAKAVIKAESV